MVANMNIPLKCRCGSIRGLAKDVTANPSNRLICMCDDCQAYAHHLGCANRVLDRHGGTDIFQTTPSRIEITDGHEHLRLLRLTPKGLLRWYAGCCKTPIANTAGAAWVPFVGVVHTFMDHSAGPSRDEALGPVIASIHGRFAVGGLPHGAYARAPARLILRFLRFFATGIATRGHSPSPFFVHRSSKPIVEASVLSASEREALRSRCGPNATP